MWKNTLAVLNACLVLAVLVMAPAPPSVFAQRAALVLVRPPELRLEEGETGRVDVVVDDVEDLYGLDIRISFDPAIAEVVDADPDSGAVQVRPGDLLNLDFVVKNEADNDAGTVWFALTQLNPSEPVSGSGVACSVMFRGLQAGAIGTIAITQAQLASRAGEEIPATIQGGRIEVVAASEPPGEGTGPAPSATATEQMPAATVVTAEPTAPAATDTPGAAPQATETRPTASPTASPTGEATDVPTATPVAGGDTAEEPTTPAGRDPTATLRDATAMPTVSAEGAGGEAPGKDRPTPQETGTPGQGAAAVPEAGARSWLPWLPWLALGLALVGVALFGFAAYLKRREPTLNPEE